MGEDQYQALMNNVPKDFCHKRSSLRIVELCLNCLRFYKLSLPMLSYGSPVVDLLKIIFLLERTINVKLNIKLPSVNACGFSEVSYQNLSIFCRLS